MPGTDIKISTSIDANNPFIGDIYVGTDGNIRLTNSLAEDVQNWLLIALRLFQGEWFLDPSQGVPYFQSILGVKQSLGVVQQIFFSAIAQCPGIQAVNSVTVTPLPNRAAQLNFSVQLADGTTLTSADFSPFIVGG